MLFLPSLTRSRLDVIAINPNLTASACVLPRWVFGPAAPNAPSEAVGVWVAVPWGSPVVWCSSPGFPPRSPLCQVTRFLRGTAQLLSQHRCAAGAGPAAEELLPRRAH